MKCEWKRCTIGDLGRIITGKTPNTKVTEYWDGNIPFVTPKDLQGTKHIDCTERSITSNGLDAVKGSTLPANSVCVSCIGNIGYTGITTQKCVTNQQINAIVVNKCNNFDFVYYLLRNLWSYFKNYEGQSTTLSILNKAQFSKIGITIPDLETQKKIAKVLSALDDKIEFNNKINKNLEEQANALFDNMFPNISQGNRTVGDYIVPKRGKSLLSKDAVLGDVPVVAGGLEPSTYHNESNTTAPVITISASGANAGYVSLWHIPVWSSDSSYIDSKMSDNVYFWYVLLKKRQKEIYDSQTGSAQPHIYPQHIAELPLSELSLESISLFNMRVTSLFAQIANNKAENAILHKTRDTLLPKLMSGEIDVDNVEI